MAFQQLSFWLFLFGFLNLWNLIKRSDIRVVLMLVASGFYYLSFSDSNLPMLLLLGCIAFVGVYLSEMGGKGWAKLSLVLQLLILVFYKYFSEYSNIVFPLALSFVAFQTLSYTIDHLRTSESEKNPVTFFSYLLMFPKMLAGPITRTHQVIPQIKKNEIGIVSNEHIIFMLAWGLFLKMVIADNIALKINPYLSNEIRGTTGGTYFLSLIGYSFQIYFDFHGYSLIAIGVLEMLGIKISPNFLNPYSAISIKDFWRRWHRSLSTWFRDYVYVPMGTLKYLSFTGIASVFVTFSLSGIWHGNTLNFLIWGLIHAFLFILERILGWDVLEEKRFWVRVLLNVKTYFLVTLTWLFFRIPSTGRAVSILNEILKSLYSFSFQNSYASEFKLLLVLIIVGELARRVFDLNEKKLSPWAKYGLSLILLVFVILFRTGSKQFIYYQF